MAALALDYSSGPPPPSAVAGYSPPSSPTVGVVRYLWTGGKGVTGPEIAALHAAGLAVAFYYEGGNYQSLRGWPGGAADAAAANGLADRLGVPDSIPITYVIEDPSRISAADWPKAEAYCAAVRAVGRRPAWGYGGQALLDHLAAVGLLAATHQVDTWSAGVGPACRRVQRASPAFGGSCAGVGVDENVLLNADWGQWALTPPAPPVPPPPPFHSYGGRAMTMSVTYWPKPGDEQYHAVAIKPDRSVWHYADPDIAKVHAWKARTAENHGGEALSVVTNEGSPDGRRYVIAVVGTDHYVYSRTFDIDAGWPAFGVWEQGGGPLAGPPAGPAGPTGPSGAAGPAFDPAPLKDEMAQMSARLGTAGQALSATGDH